MTTEIHGRWDAFEDDGAWRALFITDGGVEIEFSARFDTKPECLAAITELIERGAID